MSWQPRPHQQKAHDATWAEWDSGAHATMVTMATGTGKTAVAAMVARTALERGMRTLFLVDREILATNAVQELKGHGLDTAVEMGTLDARYTDKLFGESDVIVATVQTLHRDRIQNWPREHFGVVVTDECHRAADPSHMAVYDYFRGYSHLGLTATPDGHSCKRGVVYRSTAFNYPIKDAQRDGLIPRIEVEECHIPIDLKDIRITGGDFNAGDLAERLGPQTAYLADAIAQRIGDRSTVIFAPDTGSALAIRNALGAHPSHISAEYVAGTGGRFAVDPQQRRDAIARFHSGRSQAIVCCELLVEGWDCPRASAVVIARPTRHRYRYVQMVGRITRQFPGKETCLVVDFDWRNSGDSRDLITPVGIFAMDDPEFLELDAINRQRVLDAAKKIAKLGQKDPAKAYEEAMKQQRPQAYLPLFMTGARAEFEIRRYDPMTVADSLGVELKRADKDLKSGRYQPIKPWQAMKLRKAGVQDVQSLTFFGASKLLRAIESREKRGLAKYSDVSRMIDRGVGEIHARGMSSEMAEKFFEVDSGRL